MGHVITDFKKFGRFLRQRRIILGVTQAEFGKRCGLTKNHISRFELGIAGPDVKTFKRLAKVLELPEKELLTWAGKDQVMDGLQEMNQKIGLIFEEIKGLKEQRSMVPRLSDIEDKDSITPDMLWQVIDDIGNKIGQIETRVKSAEEAAEDAVEDQPVDLDSLVNALLDEYEGAGPDVGFFDSVLGSQEIRTAKGKMYVACCNACDSLDVNPFEKVGGFFDDVERGKAMSDILYDFSIEQIDKEEAQGKLSGFLQGEESEGEESEGEESEGEESE